MQQESSDKSQATSFTIEATLPATLNFSVAYSAAMAGISTDEFIARALKTAAVEGCPLEHNPYGPEKAERTIHLPAGMHPAVVKRILKPDVSGNDFIVSALTKAVREFHINYR